MYYAYVGGSAQERGRGGGHRPGVTRGRGQKVREGGKFFGLSTCAWGVRVGNNIKIVLKNLRYLIPLFPNYAD